MYTINYSSEIHLVRWDFYNGHVKSVVLFPSERHLPSEKIFNYSLRCGVFFFFFSNCPESIQQMKKQTHVQENLLNLIKTSESVAFEP